MEFGTLKTLKKDMAALEERLYAFKDKFEALFSQNAELQRRLNEAEERAAEADELKEKYEKLLAENKELREELNKPS